MKRLTLLVILLVLLPVVGWTATHYVSSSGTATWAESTSINNPCSIATANSNAQAGDTVYFLDGTYSSSLAPTNSGSSSARLIFQALNTHDAIISVTSGSAINLDSKAYITISGFKITSTDTHGVNADNSDHVIIRNCEFNNCITDSIYSVIIARNSTNFTASSNRLIDNTALSGIRWSGTNAEIYDNYISGGIYENVAIVVISDANVSGGTTRIHDNTITNINSGASDTSKSYEAISVTSAGDTDPRTVKHVEVTDNIISGNYGRRHRIVIYSAEDVLVARNKLIGNHTYGINVDMACKDVTVCYNLIEGGDICSLVNLGGGGIDVRQSTGGCATCTDLENINVYNNTIVDNDTTDASYYHTGLFFYCASDASFSVDGVHFKNNVVKDNYNSSTKGYELFVSYNTTPTVTDLVFDYNDYYRTSNTASFIRWRGTVYSMAQFATYQSASSQDTHSITTNPLLTSDYHLLHGSPCINAGTTISGFTSTALDIDGQPILGIPDIGCDERKALWRSGDGWHMERMY